MDHLLYFAGSALLYLIQSLPLNWVARAGRVVGGLVCYLDARHRRMAEQNLAMCFPEKSSTEIAALALENFRRIGENFGCAVRTAIMTTEELAGHVTFHLPELCSAWSPDRQGIVVAIGHFGNFELYARIADVAPRYRSATTYRGLRQPALDHLLRRLRSKDNCQFFERRTEGAALRQFMSTPNALVGLLSDQHAGDRGIPLPFLGHACSTSPAPAVFALRYNCRLLTGFCFRTGLAKWHIEGGPEIPTHVDGKPRPTADIMLEVNQALEQAVLRDPANWFWVHNRWKLKFKKQKQARAWQQAAPR